MNTGRSWATTRFLFKAIPTKKLRYALVEHGSELWDIQSDRQIDLADIAATTANHAATAALASTKHIARLISWFHSNGSRELCQRLGHSGHMEGQRDKSSNLTFLVPAELDGALVLGTLQELIAEQADFDAASLVYHYSDWNRYLDVMGAMDKGVGLALTMDFLGVDLRYAAAIGDGLNDIPMLQQATLPLCPSNAAREVRELCEQRGYVSSSSYIGATLDWHTLNNQ